MCFFSMENFARPSSSDTKDDQNTYIINLRYVKSELYKRKKMHFCISSLKKKGVKIGSELLRLIEVGDFLLSALKFFIHLLF